jgi:hypothetical protein
MSANLRRVLASGYVPWPSAQYPVWIRAGSAVDVVPGSAMELAYGVQNLTPVLPPPGNAACFDKSAVSN